MLAPATGRVAVEGDSHSGDGAASGAIPRQTQSACTGSTLPTHVLSKEQPCDDDRQEAEHRAAPATDQGAGMALQVNAEWGG